MNTDMEFEKNFWGDCTNTFDEDQKHYVYGRCMGLVRSHYSFLVKNKNILDIGGGPSSMLLKCQDLGRGKIIDPIEYPAWTRQRYLSKNIVVDVINGEDITETGWDEVWIYNCLQHTHDPGLIIANALLAAPVLRLFEWINLPSHPGHPHQLTEQTLNSWLGGWGTTSKIAEAGCFGQAYYGVFS